MTRTDAVDEPDIHRHPALQRRTGGARLGVVVDLVKSATWSRNWILLMVLIIAIAAAILATAVQTVVPWVVYPAV